MGYCTILRVAVAAMLISVTASAQELGQRGQFDKGMAWHTTDTATGAEELCISFHVGNTNQLSINKGYRTLTLSDMSPLDVEDCLRGLKIAQKKHTVQHFTPDDLKK